jgi:hypothetical protein
VNAVPRAAVDPGHPGETGTINAAFKLKWQPTDKAALQELDDLAAAGTHGIKAAAMSAVAADGNRVLRWKAGCCVLLSWYHQSGGTTDMTRITVGPRPEVESDGAYRIVLLAVPSVTGAGTLAVSDVRPKPAVSAENVGDLTSHVGGIAVDGDRLYVADTSGGFRVFNMAKSYQVTTGKSTLGLDDADGKFYARGAKYALFQEGRYVYDATAGRCKDAGLPPDGPDRDLCFSTVSVDRSYPTPGLVSTEYRRAAGVVSGRPVRVVRWPLNADGTLKADGGGVVTSTTVYGTYTPRVQRVAAHYTQAQATSVYYNTSLTVDGVVQPGTISATAVAAARGRPPAHVAASPSPSTPTAGETGSGASPSTRICGCCSGSTATRCSPPATAEPYGGDPARCRAGSIS